MKNEPGGLVISLQSEDTLTAQLEWSMSNSSRWTIKQHPSAVCLVIAVTTTKLGEFVFVINSTNCGWNYSSRYYSI